MSDNVIEAQNLTKRYGGTTVVKGISFSVARGEIFGLLGPNGAGKTTTILMLLGLSDISAGKARVLGHDPVREPLAVKRRVGYLPDPGRLLRQPHRRRQSALHRAPDGARRGRARGRIASALAHVGLARRRRQARRHLLARHAPAPGARRDLDEGAQIAILDEPTSGLDPQATLELLDIIRYLKHRGRHRAAVVASARSRAERVRPRRAVQRGQHRAHRHGARSSAARCSAAASTSRSRRKGRGSPSGSRTFPASPNVEAPGPNRLRLMADRDVRPEAAAAVVAAGGRLLRLSVEEPSLEAIYTRYFQRPRRERVMRREGSALHGLGVVTLKELADHFTSARVRRALEWLVVLTALAAVYGAIQQIKDVTAEDPFLFLRLFTTSREPLPSFVAFLTFLVPLIAIGLGFDAVNGEHNRRTLSRILSQPIYRDALLFGKFLAGLFTLSVSLIVLWLLVIGLGLLGLEFRPMPRKWRAPSSSWS